MPLLPRHPVSAFRAFPSSSVAEQRPRDVTAPHFAFAIVNSNSLKIECGKQLHADFVPVASDFAVLVQAIAATISAVALSGSSIVLTLSAAVNSGAPVTVAYTKPAANRRAQDLEYNDLPSFAAQTVSNTTGQTLFWIFGTSKYGIDTRYG